MAAKRITRDQWIEARAKREAGETLGDVAKFLGVDRALVSRRAKAENWSDGADLEEVIRKKVTERVTGVMGGVTPHDPKKREEALDAAAALRADVEIRHQVEWVEHKSLLDLAIGTKDFETAKLAKITAETLKIRQEGERKAWRLDVQAPLVPTPAGASVVITLPPEEYERRARQLVAEV